jgi:hypothetical protein
MATQQPEAGRGITHVMSSGDTNFKLEKPEPPPGGAVPLPVTLCGLAIYLEPTQQWYYWQCGRAMAYPASCELQVHPECSMGALIWRLSSSRTLFAVITRVT